MLNISVGRSRIAIQFKLHNIHAEPCGSGSKKLLKLVLIEAQKGKHSGLNRHLIVLLSFPIQVKLQFLLDFSNFAMAWFVGEFPSKNIGDRCGSACFLVMVGRCLAMVGTAVSRKKISTACRLI
jgi:hypothetical protein